MTSIPHQSNKTVSAIISNILLQQLRCKIQPSPIKKKGKGENKRKGKKNKKKRKGKVAILLTEYNYVFFNCSLNAFGLTYLFLISNLHNRIKLYIVVIAQAI